MQNVVTVFILLELGPIQQIVRKYRNSRPDRYGFDIAFLENIFTKGLSGLFGLYCIKLHCFQQGTICKSTISHICNIFRNDDPFKRYTIRKSICTYTVYSHRQFDRRYCRIILKCPIFYNLQLTAGFK